MNDIQANNMITENLLMETAMCIMEKYIELEGNGALDSNKTEIDSLIRLQDFCDMAREFEEKYRGTEEYDNDFFSVIDEFSAKKILERYGADKEEKEKEEGGIEREDRLMEIAMYIMDQYTCMSGGDLIDVDAVEEEMAVTGGFQLFCQWAREFAENHPDSNIIHDEIRKFAKAKLIDIYGRPTKEKKKERTIEIKTVTRCKLSNLYYDSYIINDSEYDEICIDNQPPKEIQNQLKLLMDQRSETDFPQNVSEVTYHHIITDIETGEVICDYFEQESRE